MSVTQTIADRILGNKKTARQKAIALAVRLVEGGKATDEQILNARLAADLSAEDFTVVLSNLESRKQAEEALENGGFANEIRDAKAKAITCRADLEEAEKQAAEARQKVRDLHEECRILSGKMSGLQKNQTEAGQERAQVFRETGGGDDWKDFS